MKYKCNVINNDGKKYNKVYEASDQLDLITVVRNDNMYLISQKIYKDKKIRHKKLKMKDMIMFCRQMGIMLDAGITITEALSILDTKMDNKTDGAYGRLFESIQIGNSLSNAMMEDGIYEDLFINMVDAGERSGTLEANFNKMAEHYEKQNKLNNKVKQALIYPAALSVMTVAVVIFMVVMVVPTFAGMYEGHDLPLPTQILMGLSDFLINNYVICIIVTVAIVFGYIFSRSIYKVRMFYDSNQLRMPIIGKLYKTIYSANLARSFASLYASGLGIITIMEILPKVLSNYVIKERFVQVVKDIQEGSSITKALEKVDIFDAMLISMIYIGEETGSMDVLLNKAADYFDEEADSASSQLVGILEPAIIVVMAVVVGFIIIAIIMPMYGMMQYV